MPPQRDDEAMTHLPMPHTPSWRKLAARISAGLSISQRRALAQLMLAEVLVLAIVLRFFALGGSSLWSDEGNTWALVQRTWGEIARDAAVDIHPPGYYWLLKAWTALAGSDAVGMRSLSALIGVGVAAMIYAIGRRISPALALTAALLAAVNPFQVYYSQEARMYMLLAAAGAGLFWALIVWFDRDRAGQRVTAPLLGFVAAGSLGLWTHYSFPILLSAAGLAYLWHWRGLLAAQGRAPGRATRRLTLFLIANLVIVLSFSPWLPTAVNRVLNWPKGGLVTAPAEGIRLTLHMLTFGPLRDLPDPTWPWLAAAGLLPVIGLFALAHRGHAVTLGLWMLAPVGLMFALGLFSDAFLKFLLVASPAWLILIAAAPDLLPWPNAGRALLAAGALLLAALTLPAYYAGDTVRDNYAGVARYITATGDPAADLVVLDAPGQADVWRYYDPGLPIAALPRQRPPDPADTQAALAAAAEGKRQIFALFWATDEADPDRIVETWLDQHAFRGLESWQGNLRFVVYTQPQTITCADLTPTVAFGDAIMLLAHCQPGLPQAVASGQTALVELRWRAAAPLASRYKVSVQLIDARSQVIAQHDAEPAGGSRPTDGWTPGETVGDNHGLAIPPGTPPGLYTLIVAVYDEATGVRLPTPGGDAYPLGQIEVTRPDRPVPAAVAPIRIRSGRRLGPVTLVGYDLHRKGYSHDPDTPLQPGDLVHITLLWQASIQRANWPADLTFSLHLGDQTLTAPLAGGDYPTAQWQPGELVRGEFDLVFDGSGDTPRLEVDGTTLRLQPLPHE